MADDKGKKAEEKKDEAGAEDAAAVKPKNKKKLVIMVAGVVVILGIIAGLLLSGGSKEKTKEHKEEKQSEAAAEEEAPCPAAGGGEHGKKEETPCHSGPVYKDVPDLLVNLQTDTRRPHFISLKVTLEVKNSRAAAETEAAMPRIVDSFNTYLREMTKEELEGSAGLERLETEMMLRIDKIIKPGSVTDILFRSVIIQ